MLILDDALREVERNLKNMNIAPEKVEIDENIIDLVSKKGLKKKVNNYLNNKFNFYDSLKLQEN